MKAGLKRLIFPTLLVFLALITPGCGGDGEDTADTNADMEVDAADGTDEEDMAADIVEDVCDPETPRRIAFEASWDDGEAFCVSSAVSVFIRYESAVQPNPVGRGFPCDCELGRLVRNDREDCSLDTIVLDEEAHVLQMSLFNTDVMAVESYEIDPLEPICGEPVLSFTFPASARP